LTTLLVFYGTGAITLSTTTFSIMTVDDESCYAGLVVVFFIVFLNIEYVVLSVLAEYGISKARKKIYNTGHWFSENFLKIFSSGPNVIKLLGT
jgi:hypothetical protein